MRYFILFGIPIIIVLICGFIYIAAYLDRRKPGTGKALNNLEAIGTAADAVRALDQLLTDPTLIASSEWTDNAKAIVREWYGPSRKQIGR